MRSSISYFFLFLFLATSLVAKEGSVSLDHLNDIRQKSGLLRLKSNSALNKAAQAHARYLITHQKAGHMEHSGYRGYTGKSPAQRATASGYPSKDVMENISVNTNSDRASIDALFAAIYHRFVFLSFDKDEIGSGKAVNRNAKRIQSAYVYKLGASKLRYLCQTTYLPVGGVEYVKNVCKNSEHLIPNREYERQSTLIKAQNAKVVLHPYPGQTEVRTVFYNETPDPLPDYKVSGYPISVQFNDAYHDAVTLKRFRLFDAEGKEVSPSRVLTHKSDPHGKLKKMEFALMPMKRLEYGMSYRAEFEALVDGKPYKKVWRFSTKTFKERLYRVTKKRTELKVEPGGTVILYFVPQNRNDILSSYRASKSMEITFIDQNTIKVTLPKKKGGQLRVEASNRTVLFN